MTGERRAAGQKRETHRDNFESIPGLPHTRHQGHTCPSPLPCGSVIPPMTRHSALPGISVPKPLTASPSLFSHGGGSAWLPEDADFLSHVLVPLGRVWRQKLLARHCYLFHPKSPFLLKSPHPVLWAEAIASAASLTRGHRHS